MSTLKLVPKTADMINELTTMGIDAFTTNPVSRLMNGAPTPEHREEKRRRHHEGFQRSLASPNPRSFDLVAIDTALPPTIPSVPEGAIVAQAHWVLEQEGDMYNTDVDGPPLLPGGNREAKRVFWGLADQERHRCVRGRPVMHLTVICTNPKYQRRGAARFLVEWGMRKAEELKVPVYLGASEQGKPLYVKCGFTQTGEMPVDLTPFGLEGVSRNYSFMWYPEGVEKEEGLP